MNEGLGDGESMNYTCTEGKSVYMFIYPLPNRPVKSKFGDYFDLAKYAILTRYWRLTTNERDFNGTKTKKVQTDDDLQTPCGACVTGRTMCKNVRMSSAERNWLQISICIQKKVVH